MKKLVLLSLLICLAMSVFAGIEENADVYLPFEGADDNGIDSPCWLNKGTGGYDVGPTWYTYASGADGAPVATVTGSSGGIKGQAMDMSHFTGGEYAKVPFWGVKGSSTNAIEDALNGAKSMTWSFWAKRTDSENNGIMLYSPAFLPQDRSTKIKFYMKGSWTWSGAGPSTSDWKFIAVTADQTGNVTTDNVKVYMGSVDEPVELISSHTLYDGNPFGTDQYFGIGFNHPGTGHPNPFVGFMDEFRIFADQQDSSAVLSLQELEAVRQYDLVPEPMTMLLLAGGAFMIKRRK